MTAGYRRGVADNPPWRQGYDVLERQVGPRLERIVRSEQFAVAVGLLARAQRSMEAESGRITRRVLHRLNLPAGSDVTRILNEIGQLRRQVHDLTVELDDTRAELAETTTAPTRTTASGTTTSPRKRVAKKAPAKTPASGRKASARARTRT